MGRKSLGIPKLVISDEEAQKRITRIMTDGVLLILDCGKWGNRKTLAKDLAEEWFGKNKKAMRAVHDLIDKEAWDNVLRPMTSAQTKIRNMALPWYMPGFHFIHKTRMDEARNVLDEAKKETLANLDDFLSEYPTLREKFRLEHPDLFDPLNYPSADMIRRKLRFRWSFQDVTPPFSSNGKVSILSEAQMKEEQAKWREQVKGAAEAGIGMMRKAFAEIITHLRDVLADPDKTFHESTVEKPKKFLEELASWNVWGDIPFTKIAGDAAKLLSGVYADDLRDDDSFRKLIGNGMDDIVKEFKQLPTIEVERAIDF